MRKPDRFERMVHDIGVMHSSSVVKLLRLEHAWMKRMVRHIDRWQAEQLADNEDVIAAILEQLDQRRK